MSLVSSFLIAGSLVSCHPVANASLVLQSKIDKVCLDFFCRKQVKMPFRLIPGNTVITREGIAKWTALYSSANITQLSCTRLELKQSQLWLGALVLDVRISPVLGCHYKPRAIIKAKRMVNKNSSMKYSFLDRNGRSRYVSIVGTEIAIGESEKGNTIVGIKNGVAKLDTGRLLTAGQIAEATSMGWTVQRLPKVLLVSTTSTNRYGDPRVLVVKDSSVFVDGTQAIVNKDGSMEVPKGSRVDVVDVTGNTTSFHVAAHGLRVTQVR
jgi:hypothetical protein